MHVENETIRRMKSIYVRNDKCLFVKIIIKYEIIFIAINQ